MYINRTFAIGFLRLANFLSSSKLFDKKTCENQRWNDDGDDIYKVLKNLLIYLTKKRELLKKIPIFRIYISISAYIWIYLNVSVYIGGYRTISRSRSWKPFHSIFCSSSVNLYFGFFSISGSKRNSFRFFLSVVDIIIKRKFSYKSPNPIFMITSPPWILLSIWLKICFPIRKRACPCEVYVP